MKSPFTLALLPPYLFLCFALFGDKGAFLGLVLVAITFLVEIRIRYGELTQVSIQKFFNTPIQPVSLFAEQPLDNSTKVPLLLGVVIILIGAIGVFLSVAFVIAFFP